MNGPQMNRSATSGAPRQRRFGLMKLLAGFAAIRAGEDGKEAQYQVRERRLFPDAKVVVTCLTCKRDYKSEEECGKKHPEMKVMVRKQESHVVAFWSDDPDPASEARLEAWMRTRDLAQQTGQTFTDPEPALMPIGYLSDAE